MTQTVVVAGNEPEHRFLGAESAVTVPASGLTTLATIKTQGKSLLCFHFDVATQNLDDFDVLIKAHPDATQRDITPADWTALVAGGRFLHASANLAAVVATGNGYLEMDVAGLDEVQVKVSAASDSASVTAKWSLV